MTTMRAMLVHELGGIDNLRPGTVDVPTPGPGEVRITVKAAGVNFPDVLLIAGLYQADPDLPFSPGTEASGVISALGPDVTNFAIGDRVVGTPLLGCYAEEVVVPAALCDPIPDGLTYEDAAVLPIAYGTALHALRDRAQLEAGQTVLVTGATGGVGSAVIKLAVALGATVIAAVGSQTKADVARAIGASEVVMYGAETRLRDQVKALAPGGVDVLIDNVGGDVMAELLRCVAWDGRVLIVGFAGGEIPQIPANLVLLKGCSIVGVFWGRWRELDPDTASAQLAELAAMVAAGDLDTGISATVPLESATDALHAIANRTASGKLIIVP